MKHLKIKVIHVKDSGFESFLSRQPNGDVLAITLVEVVDGRERRVADVNAKLIDYLNKVEIPIANI